MLNDKTSSFKLISIVIPVRNEEANIEKIIRSILFQRPQDSELELIVVDDNSTDRTVEKAKNAGAKVLSLGNETKGGNPAIARNKGAAISRGDPIIFLDGDCIPEIGWLDELLSSHSKGAEVVGGSLALPSDISATARCDYYCGWYHVHPKRCGGIVDNHPPCNLSVQRASFKNTQGFFEQPPIAYSHEELAWQAELKKSGGTIFFNPMAKVYHYNRPGLGNLLRRNYRWGYGAIESKADFQITRFSSIYRFPHLLLAMTLPLGILSALYVIVCWLKAAKMEILVMWPVVFAARMAYAVGMMVGGIRWLYHRDKHTVSRRPRWE